MSAFVMTHLELSALVNFARIHEVNYLDNMQYWRKANTEPSKLAQMLLDENQRSINQRYDKTEKVIINYTRFPVDNFSLAEIAKLCACYVYQICETDDYKESEAFRFVTGIKEKILSLLPGYESAEWGLNTDKIKHYTRKEIEQCL